MLVSSSMGKWGPTDTWSEYVATSANHAENEENIHLKCRVKPVYSAPETEKCGGGKVLYARKDQKLSGSGVVVFFRMKRETALNEWEMEVVTCGRNYRQCLM
jgi:hypothetical protein